MSGAFSAKVDISTKEAVAGLRAARDEAKLFGQGLNDLDKIIRNNKQNLVLAVQQFTALVAAQERAARISATLAKVKIDEARAQGIANVATGKAAVLNATAANQNAAAGLKQAQANHAVARTTAVVTQTQTAATNATTRQANAAQRASQSQLQLHDSLSNTRYLMYDVGATYGVIAAGLMAIPAATAAVAMAYQKDFAQVERVSNDAVSKAALPELRESLKDIANDIPVAFGELSRITQLGAQMGVANTKLSEFTETTAKFVAVTGISADAGSQLFGRMETSFTEDVERFPDFFERMGSSIAHVGAETVATDPEIAALLNQIGPLGAQAGFTAAEITGLSAALASVRVQPELARGTLTRIFGQLNRDVAEGSPRLAEYGKMMGMTADEAGKLWKSDPAQFFQSLIKGLNETHVNGGNLTTTLDKLGIKASRDVSAITKLAVGYNVLEKSMDAADKGFSEGTALNEMSKPIFETAVAKLQKMANAWQNLADTLGASSLGPMAALIDIATNLAVGLDNLIDDVPMIGMLITALMGMAAVTAIFLGFKAAQAFVIAGFVGFQQASTRGIGASMSLSGVLRQAAQTMLITKGATDQQSRALLGQVGAWKALQIAASTTSNQLRSGTAGSFGVLATGTAQATGGLKGFGSAMLGMVGGPIGIAVIALSALAGGFLNASIEAQQAGKTIAEAMDQSADAGRRAIAEALNNRKVQLSIGEGDISFHKLNQSVTEVARGVDVSFEDIVKAVEGGTESAKRFQAKMDELKAKAGLDKGRADAYGWLGRVAVEMANNEETAAKGLKDVAAAAPVAGKSLKGLGDDGEEAASDIDVMTKALKDLNDEVFGIINAEAALQSSLSKIGEGLHESGSFSTNSEAGRENLENFQDAMEKSRTYYTQLMADSVLTSEQAAQGYADFVQGLINEIRVQGGDTSGIEALAVATAQRFRAVIDTHPASVPVEVETTELMDTATNAWTTMQSWYAANQIKAKVGLQTTEVDAKLEGLAHALSSITGIPFEVVMDALTDPAHEKSRELEALLLSITDGTYTAAVDADTTAAVTNVQNFVAYANTELSKLQTRLNGGVGLADGEGSMSPAQKAQYGQITTKVAAPRQVRAAAPAPRTNLGQNLGGIGDGYKKAAAEAEKAGKKAKKAAKDIADGIDDAVKSAEDFGNRLKTALTSAFNQQYGLTKATDEYHSALNAINKKRDEEIKQLDELKQKVIDLNNERNKELITANKAKIEQNISLKYGEGDRAADYGLQAKTALDNAAAKQKDIVATNAQSKELSDGIGALTGYSDAAIANRAALRDLEMKMIDMIAAYAATGASSEQVRAYAQQLTGQFQTDVGQIGFNIGAVTNLQGSFQRYIDTINRVPQFVPTEVEADTDEAMGELGAVADQLGELALGVVVPVTVNPTLNEAKLRSIEAQIKGGGSPDDPSQTAFRPGSFSPNYMGGPVQGFSGGGKVPGKSPSNPRMDNMMAKVDGKGLIGIRSGEFIVKEPAVDYYGPSFMEAVNTMKLPKYFMGGSPSGSTGGGGSAGSGVVDLGAATLAAMAEMRQEIKLYTENRVIAESANNGNRELAAEGRN